MNSHNPYFNRWFSAIKQMNDKENEYYCHNPYFNRWFSAINYNNYTAAVDSNVTILILIDGFLQYQVQQNFT